MRTEPVNFKGIYHKKVNVKNTAELQGLMLAKDLERESGAKIVLQHQNIGIIFEALAAYKASPDYPYGLSWLFSHAKTRKFELPKYLTDKVYDVYILTDKDKNDYERKLEKRENIDNAIKIALKTTNRVNKKMKGEPEEDIFIQKLIETDKTEQALFDKFLRGRKVEPMDVDFGDDGSVHAKLN